MTYFVNMNTIELPISSEDKRKIEELRRSGVVNFQREFHNFIDKLYQKHQSTFWGSMITNRN